LIRCWWTSVWPRVSKSDCTRFTALPAIWRRIWPYWLFGCTEADCTRL
jgi:hypothetical protein